MIAQSIGMDGVQDRLGLSGEPANHWDDFERICRAAVDGSVSAEQVVENSASALATALLSLTNVLDLERLVLTGPGFDIAGDIYARRATEMLTTRALIRNAHQVHVRLSASRRDSAALGAATLVIHQRLGSPRRSRIGAGV